MSQLDFYWQLASVSKEERLKAAQGLIEFLTPEKQSDIDYALNRLIRGLPSSREASRQGFCLALTQLITTVPETTFHQIIALLDSHTQINGNIKAKEERDIYFGKIFGYLSIVQSGLINKNDTTYEEITCLIDSLLQYSTSKIYLREACYSIIITMIRNITNHKLHVLDYCVSNILKSIDHVDQLWMAIVLQDMKHDISSSLSNWKTKTDILSLKNMVKLAEITKESTFAHPHVHSIWNEIINYVLKNDPKILKDVWNNLIEDSLFDSSHERKYMGFQLFLLIAPRLSIESIAFIFTKKFMRTFINHLSSPKNYLHKAAKQIALKLSDIVKENRSIAYSVILQLTGINGIKQFDSITKTKTIESLTLFLDQNGAQEYFNYLQKEFENTKTARTDDPVNKETHRQEKWIIDQFQILIRNGKLTSSGLIKQILEFVSKVAFSSHVLLSQYALLRLSSILSELISITVDSSKKGLMENGKSWASFVVDFIQTLDSNHDLDSKIYQSRVACLNLLQTISKIKGTNDTIKLSTFESMISHVYILSFTHPEIASAIPDLKSCFSRLFPDSDSLLKKRKIENTEDLNPCDVLLDILFVFMAIPSALIRSVSENVFKIFCSGITLKGINLIFEVLENKNQAEDIEDTDDEDLEDEDTQEDETDQEDENEDADIDNIDDDTSSESSTLDEDGDRNAISKEDLELLKQTLKTGAPELFAENESEEEFLDDDEMGDFDLKLVEIFKEKAKLKKKKELKKNDVSHFKARILDFIDIYIKKQPENPLLMSMIIPLVRYATKSSSEYQIHEKINTILKNKLIKVKQVGALDTETGKGIVSELHCIASRSSKKPFILMCGSLCQLVAKAMFKKEKESLSISIDPPKKKKKFGSQVTTSITSVSETLFQIYSASLEKMVTKKSCEFNHQFFGEFSNRYPEIGWRLCEKASELTNLDTACRLFQLLECPRFIALMLSRTNKKDSIEYNQAISKCITKLQANLDAIFLRIENENETKEVIEENQSKISVSKAKDLLKIVHQIERYAKKLDMKFVPSRYSIEE